MAGAPAAESDLDDSATHFESDEVVEFQNFSNEEVIQMTSSSSSELFLPLVIITAILGGLTIFYLVKYFKK